LIVKTLGIAGVIRAALAGSAANIRVAFIYGSVAKGTEKTESDVDVMVIGDIGFGEVVSALRPAQDQLAREINPSVFSSDEMRRRISEADHFFTTIMREDKVFLIGDEHDLTGLA
jgi:predicted nucleotidyltransferase